MKNVYGYYKQFWAILLNQDLMIYADKESPNFEKFYVLGPQSYVSAISQKLDIT